MTTDAMTDYAEMHAKARRAMLSHVGVTLDGVTENDVSLSTVGRNIICIDPTGTESRLTRIDSLLLEGPTREREVSVVPFGADARFAWTTPVLAKDCIVLDFDTAIFQTYVPEIWTDAFSSGHLVPTAFHRNERMTEIGLILARELDHETSRGRLFSDTAIRLMLLELSKTMWSRPVVAQRLEDRMDRRITRALEFIEATYRQDVSLVEISQASGMSATHLTSLFQKHLGQTPYAYVINRRVKAAVELLQQTPQPISWIALETGFADQQHMTRAFRARLGTTPRAVRMA